MITYKTERGKYNLDHNDAVYFFSNDDSTFCDLKGTVVEIDKRLYEVAEELYNFGFIRISKWNVVNANMIQSAFRLFNSRIKIKLTTGKELYVNREYIKQFISFLNGKDENNA